MNFFRGKLPYLYLTIIATVSFLLRFSRIELLKIYSDSYKFLLIANSTFNGKWISEYYPSFLQLKESSPLEGYKWLFGIVVGSIAKLLSLIGQPNHFLYSPILIERTAILLSIFAGVIAIFVLNGILKNLKLSVTVIVVLITLFAFSGVYVIWSGFIITDIFAALILLLFIYLLTYRQTTANVIALGIMSPVLWYARLELQYAALLLIGASFLYFFLEHNTFLKRNGLRLALLLANMLFFAVLLLNTLSGVLITAIFAGDLLFWVLLYMCISWSTIALFVPKLAVEHSFQSRSVLFALKITASGMMMIYYFFNKEMGRYILLVMPYFLVIVGIELEGILSFLAKTVQKKKLPLFLLIGTTLVLFVLQLNFILAFPKYTLPDYHTEVSTQVIALITAKERDWGNIISKRPVIYVAQQDPFLWANFYQQYDVEYLNKDNYSSVVESMEMADSGVLANGTNHVYFFEDESLQHKSDAYFKQNSKFTLIKEVKETAAPFWVNATQKKGWYRVWYVSWD